MRVILWAVHSINFRGKIFFLFRETLNQIERGLWRSFGFWVDDVLRCVVRFTYLDDFLQPNFSEKIQLKAWDSHWQPPRRIDDLFYDPKTQFGPSTEDFHVQELLGLLFWDNYGFNVMGTFKTLRRIAGF